MKSVAQFCFYRPTAMNLKIRWYIENSRVLIIKCLRALMRLTLFTFPVRLSLEPSKAADFRVGG